MNFKESSLIPSEKTIQIKSAQLFKKKIVTNSLKPTLKTKDSPLEPQQKFSKFDTPEKRNYPMQYRDLPKSSIQSNSTPESIPFPSKIKLFSKKIIGSLVKSQANPSKKFNPMHLAPVLINRKEKTPEPNLKENIPITPIESKIEDLELSEFKLVEIAETQNTSEVIQEELEDLSNKLFFYKAAQPSFGEEFEKEPVFLSDRVTNEYESNQSLRGELKNIESENWGVSESVISLQSACEKFDSETQTDEDAFETMLKVLDDQDVRVGIRFITKIAKFVQTLNV